MTFPEVTLKNLIVDDSSYYLRPGKFFLKRSICHEGQGEGVKVVCCVDESGASGKHGMEIRFISPSDYVKSTLSKFKG